MDRLALLNWFLFMFLRPCVSDLAGAGRPRTRVCVGIAGECRESLIGKKGESKTCRLPDVPVKAVSAAQVHGEVSEACTCFGGILGRSPAGHLTSCLGLAQLRTSTRRARLVPSCAACCMFSDFFIRVKQKCRAEKPFVVEPNKRGQ